MRFVFEDDDSNFYTERRASSALASAQKEITVALNR